VFTFSDHQYVYFQVTYIGNTTLKHGNDYGDAPTGTIVLGTGEHITSVFGRADRSINSIGITTSMGATYGPWGGPEGVTYSIPGPVYGFHGGLQGDVLGSLGTWTLDSPQMASKYMVPNQPGMMRSKMFGGSSLIDSEWDDGSTFSGKTPALEEPMRLHHRVLSRK
jgi:hypothetical protein